MAHEQARLYTRMLASMKPGATLGLSHGFLLGVMQNDGANFREDINVILMAPKVSFNPQLPHRSHTVKKCCSRPRDYVLWEMWSHF